MNLDTSFQPLPEPQHPPDSVDLHEPSQSLSSFSFALLQLNAHCSEAVLQNVLHHQSHHVLLIQEPWISKHTLLLVTHPAWHLVIPMGHNPSSLDDRAKTCIYITKTIPTKSFILLPTHSALLTAVDLDDPSANLRLRHVSWYNPPHHFQWATGAATVATTQQSPQHSHFDVNG